MIPATDAVPAGAALAAAASLAIATRLSDPPASHGIPRHHLHLSLAGMIAAHPGRHVRALVPRSPRARAARLLPFPSWRPRETRQEPGHAAPPARACDYQAVTADMPALMPPADDDLLHLGRRWADDTGTFTAITTGGDP